MTIGTLAYVFLFLIGLFISVFYLEYGTVAIMGLLILIPISMLIFLIFMRTRVKVQVDSKTRWQKKMIWTSRPDRPLPCR